MSPASIQRKLVSMFGFGWSHDARPPTVDHSVARFPRAASSVSSRALIDLAGQQVVWWSAVGLVLSGRERLAPIPALLFVALSIWGRGRSALFLALLGALLGLLVDSALVRSGAIRFPSASGGPLTTPWMVGLWAAFGVAFSASMAWLCRRGWFSAVVFGAAAGVLAYRAGASLGVLAIGDSPRAFVLVGVGWALAVSLLRLGALRISTTKGAP